MSKAIKISLARNGKIVVLDQATTSIAFNNLWGYRPRGSEGDFMRLTERKWHKNRSYTIWQILVKYHLVRKPQVVPKKLSCKLNESEIKFVENFINTCLLEKGFCLSPDENKIGLSTLSRETWAINKKNTLYIVRYGLKFLLEFLPTEKALSSLGKDLVLENQHGKVEQVYYHSLVTNTKTSSLEIKLSNFWNRSEYKFIPLTNFKPQRIFLIKEIVPCEGFEIV